MYEFVYIAVYIILRIYASTHIYIFIYVYACVYTYIYMFTCIYVFSQMQELESKTSAAGDQSVELLKQIQGLQVCRVARQREKMIKTLERVYIHI